MGICIFQALSYDGTKGSISPRTCKEGMTPGELPVSSNGSPDGSTITMTEIGGKLDVDYYKIYE